MFLKKINSGSGWTFWFERILHVYQGSRTKKLTFLADMSSLCPLRQRGLKALADMSAMNVSFFDGSPYCRLTLPGVINFSWEEDPVAGDLAGR